MAGISDVAETIGRSMTRHTLKMSLAMAVASIAAVALAACDKPHGASEAASAEAAATASPSRAGGGEPPAAASAGAPACAPSDDACNAKQELNRIVQAQDRENTDKKFFDDLNRSPTVQQPGDTGGGDAAP
jgi:hypothetical protein